MSGLELPVYGGGARVAEVQGLPTLMVEGYDLSILDAANLDPYLDKRARMGRVQDECSTSDPTKYHDPGTQFTSIDGAPLINKMRPGRWGLRGTIVPRATWFGGSQGVNPHKPQQHVHVDPGTKQHIEIDISRVTAANAKEAMRIVQGAVGAPRTIEELRLSQSATFHVLQQMEANAVPRQVDDRGRNTTPGGRTDMQFGKQGSQQSQPQIAPQQGNGTGIPIQPPPQAQPQPWGVPAHQPPQQQGWGSANQAQFAQQPAAQAVDPMAVFGPQTPAHQAPPGMPPQFQPQGQAQAPATQPTNKVTFGTALANQDAMFHSITRQYGPQGQGGILVLGVESAYPGKCIPKTSNDPIAIHVHRTGEVFKVESCGIQYEHKGELLTHFLILEERNLNQPPQG